MSQQKFWSFERHMRVNSTLNCHLAILVIVTTAWLNQPVQYLNLSCALNTALTGIFLFSSDQEEDDKEEEPHCLKVRLAWAFC